MTEVAVRPTIPAERYAARLARAQAEMTRQGFGAMFIGVGPDLVYLTGYGAMPLERLTLLVISPTSDPALIVPRLEEPAARAGVIPPLTITTWGETDDPYALVHDFIDRVADQSVVVSDRLMAMHLLRLQQTVAARSWQVASNVLRQLRMRKDPEEVDLLRLAAHAADRVVTAIAAGRLIGRTEADVAREVRERLVAEGHDEALFSIVASGPNSASPHHDASDRVIQAGEPIVLDIGGTLGGYGSDITRTLWVTGGDAANGLTDEFRRLYDVLQDAQSEATGAVRPGVPCERIDGVARGIISAAGFGDAFIHRTGHGIGLEGHEEPYLVAGSTEPLAPGMAFSVEPGIYLEGRYGARIEDIVICADSGPIVLNEVSRDLLIVAG